MFVSGRPRWSHGSPPDPRFAGSNPAGVDGFFQSVKTLSMTSFGREVKPWVTCSGFTVSKRTSNQIQSLCAKFVGFFTLTVESDANDLGFKSVVKPKTTTVLIFVSEVLLSRHQKAAAVCRRDGGIIVAHAQRALRDSIPISQTFSARVCECISIPLGAGKRKGVFRSECSVKYPRPPYALLPPSRGANTVKADPTDARIIIKQGKR